MASTHQSTGMHKNAAQRVHTVQIRVISADSQEGSFHLMTHLQVLENITDKFGILIKAMTAVEVDEGHRTSPSFKQNYRGDSFMHGA